MYKGIIRDLKIFEGFWSRAKAREGFWSNLSRLELPNPLYFSLISLNSLILLISQWGPPAGSAKTWFFRLFDPCRVGPEKTTFCQRAELLWVKYPTLDVANSDHNLSFHLPPCFGIQKRARRRNRENPTLDRGGTFVYKFIEILTQAKKFVL